MPDGKVLTVRKVPPNVFGRFKKACASRGWTVKRAICWFLVTLPQDEALQDRVSEPFEVK